VAICRALVIAVVWGGRHIEDLREIRGDGALRGLIGLEEMPSCSTFGDWLVRVEQGGGIEGQAGVNKEVVGEILAKDEREGYTLDVDATVIEAEKKEACWTYKKVKGYQPILGFLKENRLCLAYEFRQGNEPASLRAVEFLQRCEEGLPEGKDL